MGLLTGLAQRFEEIIVEPDTAGKSISYGSTVKFNFFTINKKGKKKEVEFQKIDKFLAVECLTPECNFSNGRLTFPFAVKTKNFIQGKVHFYSVKPEDLRYDQTFDIKLNFKEATVMNFDGSRGMGGGNGPNAGIPVLLRDGKAGDQGGNAGNGGPGKVITVRIKKEMDDLLKKEIYFIYVVNDSTKEESVFRCLHPEKGLEINVRGGDGGNGGKGGDGSKGKNGVKTESEDKRPGDGGNGGYGGNGGNGGKGGKVTVIAHTNAADLFVYLKIDNSGGKAGAAGRGGAGGAAGQAASGQNSGTNGKAGGDGTMGLPGEQGGNFELRVEDF